MNQTIKIEVLIGWPPTTKCRETVDVLEEVVRRHPEHVRLVVFKRGVREWPEKPSPSMIKLVHKGSTVPACFVDGELFAMLRVPTLGEVEAKVAKKLADVQE